MNIGRFTSAVAGHLLLAAACGLTIWATLTEKAVSAVGIGGMFAIGVLLTLAGLLGMRPSSLAVGKDGVTLQLVADAVAHVKETAVQEATRIATDPTVRDAVVDAKSESEAKRVAADISQRLVHALPATAEMTRKALDALT
jgi:alkylation response protein AidB-like acyl-CoA dehydrogenase